MPSDSPVEMIFPKHEDDKNHKMCEIKFDCVVSMYDIGIRTYTTGLIFKEEKPLPPQWFKNEQRLTLLAIKYSDEYEIGRIIKQMLKQLEDHIDKYEKFNK